MTKRITLTVVFLIFASVSASASPKSDTLAAVSRCASIDNDRIFLDCFYGAAQPLRAELGLPPALAGQVSLVPPASPASLAAPMATTQSAPAAPRSRGLLSNWLGGGKVETLALRMSSYTFNSRGFFIVTLSDGEVWRQVEGDDSFAHWRGPASNYFVTVRSGALGSSNLQVQGEAVTFKVEPVR